MSSHERSANAARIDRVLYALGFALALCCAVGAAALYGITAGILTVGAMAGGIIAWDAARDIAEAEDDPAR